MEFLNNLNVLVTVNEAENLINDTTESIEGTISALGLAAASVVGIILIFVSMFFFYKAFKNARNGDESIQATIWGVVTVACSGVILALGDILFPSPTTTTDNSEAINLINDVAKNVTDIFTFLLASVVAIMGGILALLGIIKAVSLFKSRHEDIDRISIIIQMIMLFMGGAALGAVATIIT